MNTIGVSSSLQRLSADDTSQQRVYVFHLFRLRSHMVEDEGDKNINERRLFHGTSPDVIGDICDEGFDWRLYGKNATAYGQGSFITGFPQALEIMENLENCKKSSMHGKIMEFEKH